MSDHGDKVAQETGDAQREQEKREEELRREDNDRRDDEVEDEGDGTQVQDLTPTSLPLEEQPAYTESVLRTTQEGVIDEGERKAGEETENPGPNEAVEAKKKADEEKREERHKAEAKRRKEFEKD